MARTENEFAANPEETATFEAAEDGAKSHTFAFLLPICLLVLVGSSIVVMSSYFPREVRGLAGLGVMLSLMAMGMPVALAMIVAGSVGMYGLVGKRALVSALENLPFHSVATWTFSVIPMFVLMGLILWRSGVTEKIFDAARAWLNWLPGGLAVATNFAGAGLAAASGSTFGIAFALGRIAVPEMIKAGYDRGLSSGVVIMAGTLGQLIPPSILLVIYAGVAEISVGPLLIAAVVPGTLTALAYATMIVARASLNRDLAPRVGTVFTWSERWRSLGYVWPVPILMVIVIGGIFSGSFTATEAGAYAAGAACLIAFAFSGRNAFRQIGRSLYETVPAVGSILLLIVGVHLLNRFFALSGLPLAMSGLIDTLGLGRVSFLLVVMVFYLFLGMFMEPLAILLLTVPIFMPTLEALDISLMWYGVFAVIVGELAIVTPPVGVLSFLVHKLINREEVRGDTPAIGLGTVFKGVLWFVLTQVVIVLLIIFFPQIVLWLPGLSFAR